MKPEAHPRSRALSSSPNRGSALSFGLVLAIALATTSAVAQAPRGPGPSTAAASGTSTLSRPASAREDGVRWQTLTAQQREALAPLEKDWPGIDAPRKQKWLALAARF